MDWSVVCEELIDVIFYILDFIGVVEDSYRIRIDVDRVFLDKWRKNMGRPKRCGLRRAL